jgi:hypothetical protein
MLLDLVVIEPLAAVVTLKQESLHLGDKQRVGLSDDLVFTAFRALPTLDEALPAVEGRAVPAVDWVDADTETDGAGELVLVGSDTSEFGVQNMAEIIEFATELGFFGGGFGLVVMSHVCGCLVIIV